MSQHGHHRAFSLARHDQKCHSDTMISSHSHDHFQHPSHQIMILINRPSPFFLNQTPPPT